jgi:hypothetical protein
MSKIVSIIMSIAIILGIILITRQNNTSTNIVIQNPAGVTSDKIPPVIAPPSKQATAGSGEHCGGNMKTAHTCSTGYVCTPNPKSHLPFGDVGGICTKVSSMHINSISPMVAAVGTNVIISGSGFTTSNTILLDNLVASRNVALSSHANGSQSISFVVPLVITPNCKAGQACPMFAREMTPGNYSVTVENQNGMSNSAMLNIVTNTNTVSRSSGEKELNFLIQTINQQGVDGLVYMEYPVAMLNGTPKTLNIGDSVGYTCQGKTATLTTVNVLNKTATFTESITTPPPGGCPI